MDANQLKSILAGAKNVMNKVETGNYTKGNVHIDTSGDDLVPYAGAGIQTQQPYQMNEQNIVNSKLPDAIKQLMLDKPIQQQNLGVNHTFTLQDVQELLPQNKHTNIRENYRAPQHPQPIQHPQPVVSNGINLSEEMLITLIENIVEKKINQKLVDEYNKNIRENIIKSTINTLIKEGKIKTKNSVNS